MARRKKSFFTPSVKHKPAPGSKAERYYYKQKQLKKNSSCYIATAVYGSYDCPEVWTLRRFRDQILAKTWYGRGFVRLYYKVSPTLVKLFGKRAWFRQMWKPVLDNMVEKLNSKGMDNTPYNDRIW